MNDLQVILSILYYFSIDFIHFLKYFTMFFTFDFIVYLKFKKSLLNAFFKAIRG